jgi:hypothetical protein
MDKKFTLSYLPLFEEDLAVEAVVIGAKSSKFKAKITPLMTM